MFSFRSRQKNLRKSELRTERTLQKTEKRGQKVIVNNGVSLPRPRNYLSVNYYSKHCLIQKIVCKILVIQLSWQTKLSKVRCCQLLQKLKYILECTKEFLRLLLPESGVGWDLGSRESGQTWWKYGEVIEIEDGTIKQRKQQLSRR